MTRKGIDSCSAYPPVLPGLHVCATLSKPWIFRLTLPPPDPPPLGAGYAALTGGDAVRKSARARSTMWSRRVRADIASTPRQIDEVAPKEVPPHASGPLGW
jgi:hypothetical protein